MLGPGEFQRNVESVLEARRRWARREIAKERLDEVIKAAGFWPIDEGLLASRPSNSKRGRVTNVCECARPLSGNASRRSKGVILFKMTA